ncbi:PAS domain S-box protein [Reichenbachiella sp. 5M10]|uniref:PAS domain-containing sensor histidine kinase n=1 Tax=Reichenbachiella sp. 5M10 TaxID=1889772 RepID=UPI0013045AEB|nr:PAS domain S-box protein [Reichenbachiella sp. 5M10]
MKRALEREKRARKEAEKILEEKSLELSEVSQKLKVANRLSSNESLSMAESELNFSFLPEAYIKTDLNGSVLEMNQSAVEILGFDIRVSPINVTDLIYRDDYLYAVNSFKSLLKWGTFSDYVARVYVKQGPPKLVHINANLIYDDQNEPSFAEGVIRDITEKSKVRKFIEEQQAELSSIVNYAPFGIILTERGTLKKFNKSFQEMIGYSASELNGMDSLKFILPEDIERIVQVQNDMDAGRIKHGDFLQQLCKKDGELVSVRVNVTTIPDENGLPKYRLSVIEDITEKVNQSALVQEQKEQLETIYEHSPLGIALSDQGRLMKVNQAFCDLLGYTAEEVLALTFMDFTFDEDLLESGRGYQRMIKGEIDKFTLKKKYIRKDGGVLYAKTNISAVRDEQGNIKYEVVVIEDVSEQESAERQRNALMLQLERSNQELNEYAHVVSHDLKSPLRSVSTLVSWIKQDCENLSDTDVHKNLDLIEATAERMEDLINGILTYSEISSGVEREDFVSVDQVVRGLIETLYIPKHVELTIAKALPRIKADEIRVQQLFQNLMSNAINYCDQKQGKVEIDYIEEGEHYVFSIRDNGEGIPKEYHEKIFGIFQSLNTDENRESTGIGLSIVKKIVDLYDGEVYLDSGVGVGTTFFVKLKKPF